MVPKTNLLKSIGKRRRHGTIVPGAKPS